MIIKGIFINPFWLGLVAGVILGTFVGIVVVSLCYVAHGLDKISKEIGQAERKISKTWGRNEKPT